MIDIVNALLPVFLIIALGQLLTRVKFVGTELWAPLDRIVYFILFPALLLRTLANADLGGLDIIPMAAALLAAIFTMVGLLTFMRRHLRLGGAEYSSLFQGSVRWNGFVGLAAAASLFGSAGTTLMALAIAVMVPTVNVLCVYILTRHAGAEPAGIGTAARALAKNPLILACAGGIVLNIADIELATAIDRGLDILGRSALTLGLLSVGAGLDLAHARATKKTVALATLLKLLGMPLLIATGCWLFGVHGLTRDVAILCGTVPGATSSYILARQLGGDTQLIASMISATTLGALITMPLILQFVI